MKPLFTQAHRSIAVATPLEEDVLLLKSIAGTDKLGQLFEYTLELISQQPEKVDIKEILGDKMTVRLNLSKNDTRYFDGYVSRFVQTGMDDHGLVSYQATLVPWLWILTRTTDCRMFHNMTVPDIVMKVFRDFGFSDFDKQLSGSYRKWEYCVQYRESAFHFVSRLMEHEGFYYYFVHEDGKHTLVLSDSPSAHNPFSGYEEIHFLPPNKARSLSEYITSWNVEHAFHPGKYATSDYNFETSKTDLTAKTQTSIDLPGVDSYEVYDYPGKHTSVEEGQNYSRVRLEQIEVQYETAFGDTDAKGVSTGHTFKLADYPLNDPKKPLPLYLVTSTTLKVDTEGFGTSDRDSKMDYSCRFTAIKGDQYFRLAQTTPQPKAYGCQTAKVVGDDGKDIDPDKYGRVKVKFHWNHEIRHDPKGKDDQDSSCWVRVSQMWAGKKWGGEFIPHVGQEVIVEFVDGDPHRPIITGRVYNDENKPPLDLPAEKTRSIIRDHGGNEMVMEGKEGEQSITLQQTCGNHIVMSGKGGEEGIKLQDKFGNKIHMDAAAGTIEFYSPSHTSYMVLGRSRVEYTESDGTKVTIGNSKTEVYGNTDEKYVGYKRSHQESIVHETNLSAKTSETLGATHELYGGIKVSEMVGLNVGTNIAINKDINVEDRIRESMKGLTYKGKKKVVLKGGAENSQLLLDSAKAYLNSGGSGIRVTKDGDIIINSKGKITLRATEDIIFKTPSGDVVIDCSMFDFTKAGDVKDGNLFQVK